MDTIKYCTGLILSANDPDKLANFYRDILNVPVVKTNHGGTQTHYECDLGDMHFAIHPVYPGQAKPINTSVKFGFAVFDLNKVIEKLRSNKVTFYGPMSADFGTVIGLVDPEGNGVNFYQHSKAHLENIESRRSDFDIVADWKRSCDEVE